MLPPPRLHQPLRRVVVTGLGCASPLGGTAAESWRRAARGESAAAQFDIDGASFVAARCGDLALDEKREKARVVGTDGAVPYFAIVPCETRTQAPHPCGEFATPLPTKRWKAYV